MPPATLGIEIVLLLELPPEELGPPKDEPPPVEPPPEPSDPEDVFTETLNLAEARPY